jgi:hypothetical protein
VGFKSTFGIVCAFSRLRIAELYMAEVFIFLT